MSVRILASRLHDGTATVALGLGFVRSGDDRAGNRRMQIDRGLDLIALGLTNLKQLERELRAGKRREVPSGLSTLLHMQAETLGLSLDLRVIGSVDSLAPSHAELLSLAGCEAMLNVRNHSSSLACRIDLDLVSCPFSFRARDWGVGIDERRGSGHGLGLLSELARWLGCRISVTSHPGLGTELVLTGPSCPLAHASSGLKPAEEEVPSS